MKVGEGNFVKTRLRSKLKYFNRFFFLSKMCHLLNESNDCLFRVILLVKRF